MSLHVTSDFLATPMVEWSAMFKGSALHGYRATSAEDLARDAESECVLRARLAAYASARGRGASHERAVKHQNRVAARVRKALGYTIAKDEVTF